MRSLFFLDVVYKKSVMGIEAEETVSIKPRSFNPLDDGLTFMLDFGDPAILDDGTMVMERFAQIMSIERITVRYAGDPFCFHCVGRLSAGKSAIPFESSDSGRANLLNDIRSAYLWRNHWR